MNKNFAVVVVALGLAFSASASYGQEKVVALNEPTAVTAAVTPQLSTGKYQADVETNNGFNAFEVVIVSASPLAGTIEFWKGDARCRGRFDIKPAVNDKNQLVLAAPSKDPTCDKSVTVETIDGNGNTAAGRFDGPRGKFAVTLTKKI